MPGLDLLIPFALATLAFAALPGPAILYTAAQTLARGKRGGLMAALGLHTGGLVHVGAAAGGLAVVFELVPTLYGALKLMGALYLLWLGFRMLMGAFAPQEPGLPKPQRSRGSFLQSVLVEVLNPKTALFFLAFLPQFVDPNAGFPLWLQLLILGQVVNIAFSMGDLVTVWLTVLALSYARSSSRAQKIAKTLGGTILLGLGARLAIASN